jgi:hypothetical protein
MRKVNSSFFSTWNKEMAYVYGFWFADGWMSQPDKDRYIRFTSADLTHLQVIQSLMGSEQKIYARKERCYDLTIGSKQLWLDLQTIGGIPAKSLVASMPDVPETFLPDFIRGFVDGDGFVYWENSQRRRPAIGMVGGIHFLKQLAVVIDEQAGVGVANVKAYPNKAPFIAYTGIKAKTLGKWLYPQGCLMLERKGLVAQSFTSWELSKFGWKSHRVITQRMQEILSV